MSASKSAADLLLLKGWLEVPKRKVSQNLRFFRLRGYAAGKIVRPGAPITSFQLISRHHVQSDLARRLAGITSESCVAVKVRQSLRPEAAQRESTERGLYDYEIEDIEVLNAATTSLPFLPNTEEGIDNHVRAQYRHIELRSDRMSSTLRERARIKSRLRRELEAQGFLEVETPLLFKSTPEGAREFLVPTRKRGHFFALPQSPQQFKQILMAGGVHRYYQFAKCFRDEDGRTDRQLEFTQLDLEMAFVTMEDVMEAISSIVLSVEDAPGQLFALDASGKIPRIKYQDAMRRYGSDKPDLRFGLEIKSFDDPDRGDTIDSIQFHVAEGQAWSNAHSKALRKSMEEHGAECLVHSQQMSSSSTALYRHVESHLDARASGHMITILARRPRQLSGGSTAMGQCRLALQAALEAHRIVPMRSTRPFNLCWVTDFPLFSPSAAGEPGQFGTSGYAATHHPFTSPHPDDEQVLLDKPQSDSIGDIRGLHYDLVMNGQEIGGGSIRIHNPALQRHVFSVLGMSDARIAQFAHLLQVLGSGCPPHGGFALGLDRFVALLCGRKSIRDVIAFPKTGSGVDALIRCPSAVPEETLKEYHISIRQDETTVSI